MEPMDRQATYYVAGEIARWQDDAVRRPLGDVRAILIARCCPALKIPILAAFTTPMKNRAFRAV
jgi:hypothetical protein